MNDDTSHLTRHPCRCGAMAELVQTALRFGPMPEVRGYKCASCGAGFAVEITAAAFPAFAPVAGHVHYAR